MKPDIQSPTQRVCFLLDIATEALCRAGTAFNNWSEFMQDAAGECKRPAPTASELIWAWNALRSDLQLNVAFGYLEPAPAWVRARAQEESAQHIVEVLPAGVIFEIQLRTQQDLPDKQTLYAKRGWPRPCAFVRLEEPLCMRPGKAARFECCSTRNTLMTPSLELTCKELATLVFGTAEEDIIFHGERGECIHVSCRSLNQAYTLASARFERQRRSRGGRIYDNFSVYYPKREWASLEMLRCAAERGGPVYVQAKDVERGHDVPWKLKL